jgi:hypothetical protein
MSPRMLRQALNTIIGGTRWLANVPGANTGFKIAYSIARIGDLLIETAWEGMLAAMPGVGTPTALPLIAQARGILQGPSESNASFVQRLVAWLTTWAQAGSAEILAQQIQSFLVGQGTMGAGIYPIVRVVDRSGNWVIANADQSLTLVTGVPFPWDNIGGWDYHPGAAVSGWWSDMWIIVAPPTGSEPIWPLYTGTSDPAWLNNFGANKATLGGGHQAPLSIAQSVLSLIATWKGAHTWFRAVIWPSNPTDFSPGSVTADGSFGNWSKNVGGVQTPDRLASARYWIPAVGG